LLILCAFFIILELASFLLTIFPAIDGHFWETKFYTVVR